MAAVQVRCPGCSALLGLAAAPAAGQQIRCTKCKSVFAAGKTTPATIPKPESAKIRCPKCYVPLSLAAAPPPGQSVRCPQCKGVFAAGSASAVDSAPKAQPAAPRPAIHVTPVAPSSSGSVQARPKKPSPAQDDQNVDDAPRRTSKKAAQGPNKVLLWSIAGSAAVVLAVVGIIIAANSGGTDEGEQVAEGKGKDKPAIRDGDGGTVPPPEQPIGPPPIGPIPPLRPPGGDPGVVPPPPPVGPPDVNPPIPPDGPPRPPPDQPPIANPRPTIPIPGPFRRTGRASRSPLSRWTHRCNCRPFRIGRCVSVTSVGGTDVYAGRGAVDLAAPERLPLIGFASE